MNTLVLDIDANIPDGVEIQPTRKVFSALVGTLKELPTGIINVALIDDIRIQGINREYSGNDYVTDVLSFSYIEDNGTPIDGVIGEMVVSYETAKRQAIEHETSWSNEIALLILHGSLHIIGYDHQTPDEQNKLQELQRALMTESGNKYREFTWEQ